MSSTLKAKTETAASMRTGGSASDTSRRDASTHDASTLDASMGLKVSVLSPLETIAQSVAGIAPTAAPAIAVAIIFGMVGKAAWLTYVVATTAVVLTAFNMNVFSRRCATAGSLYKYAQFGAGPFWGMICGWSLLGGYILAICAGSVQVAMFASAALQSIFGVTCVAWPAVIFILGITAFIAYKDIKLSAEMMLWAELSSIAAIFVLSFIVLAQHGWAIDTTQFALSGTSFEGFRLAFVFALLSFVGFETATSLGCEAKNPLSSVPRALLLSTILSGIFFVATTYAVVYGFRGSAEHLEQCSAPLINLAKLLHCQWLGTATVIGAMISFFAACIATLNTASRLILTMAHDGYLQSSFKEVHRENRTPHRGIFAVAVVGGAVALTLLFSRHSMLDIVAWTGTIACYGFIVPYTMLSVCAPFVLYREGILKWQDILLSVVATVAMSSAFIGAFYPVPAAPFLWFPYAFLGYLGLGAVLYFVRRKR